MAVIKGAVLFGHKPKEIRSRIMRKTYGCGTMTNFDDSIHSQSREHIIAGTRYCKNIFKVFVEQGEEKDVGSQERHTVYTVAMLQQHVKIDLFCMDRKPRNLDYVDESYCTKVGSFMVNTPGIGPGRPVHLDITFGGTEIQIEGQASGEKSEAKIDFMSN